jgi:hypothetical protein
LAPYPLCNLCCDLVCPSANQRNARLGSGRQCHRLPFTFWNNEWGVHSDKRCRKYHRNISVKYDNGTNILLCCHGVRCRFGRKPTIKRSLLCCARLHANANANAYSNAYSTATANTYTYTDTDSCSYLNAYTYSDSNTDSH